MRIQVGVATDIGRVREGNEDSYLVEPPFYAVADGMGGHRGGEVASQLALETMETLVREGDASLTEQVREANRAVFARSQEDTEVSGMGTTLTAAQVAGSILRLAHVGDSRGYLLRAGTLRQLTDDHTLVNRMVKAGEISASEAEVHPHRNVLTRTVGTEAEVRVDEEEVPLLEGDRVVLCSDGLFGMVAEDQIQAILEAEPDPQRAADRLIKAANRAGGVDNITVIVLEAHEDETDAVADEADDLTAGERVLREHAPSIRRWIAGAVIALVLIAGALVALRAYVDRQWYVGVADGKVAIFQGIPATPLGYDLHSVAEVTEIDAVDAESLPIYATTLDEGITANSREDADAIVAQMRADLEAAQPPKNATNP
jgi:protein phosphatase